MRYVKAEAAKDHKLYNINMGWRIIRDSQNHFDIYQVRKNCYIIFSNEFIL